MPSFVVGFFILYYQIMKRQTRSDRIKNTSKKIKIKFDFKDNTIFEKDVEFEGKPFKIKGIIDFTKSDIELQERD